MFAEQTQGMGHALEGAGKTLTDTTRESTTTLVQSFTEFWSQIVALAPKFIAAIVILVVGYLVARLVGKAVTTIGERIGLQRGAERSGLVESMQQVGIRRTVPQIVGLIFFWLLMCVFLMSGFNVLGWEAVSDALQNIIGYIPNILVATVMVVIGLLAAALLRGVIATSADRVGLSYAQQLANGAYYVLALITFLAALKHLGVELVLLNNLILIAAGAMAVGFALAFGLGGRDVIGGILAGYYIRQRMHAGDQVQVAELRGVVRDVGPVATVIETEEDGLTHRRSIPNVKMLNEAIR
ncbi:MAG: mechanosensitive ion channel [Planctomycetales bacterium]|nr:mechanosensitive ion channel [Planctomycetales bacterium]NIM08898.1 mechanosensitive ion channel [Planctomycetales bacterium]NIN08358.1 mechanosensitive ion channel [Planctomycetales bacterium]NIN77486.1 mechanosensitive ion channel [Planctomycetales bacterium]NIO34658.1 mechanosensitive ion channel [Planctomycetales bacterium]